MELLAYSLNEFKEFDTSPILVWTPVIEEDFGQERFLTVHPEILFKSGNFSKVPIMMGVTRDEFISPVKSKKKQTISISNRDEQTMWHIIKIK